MPRWSGASSFIPDQITNLSSLFQMFLSLFPALIVLCVVYIQNTAAFPDVIAKDNPPVLASRIYNTPVIVSSSFALSGVMSSTDASSIDASSTEPRWIDASLFIPDQVSHLFFFFQTFSLNFQCSSFNILSIYRMLRPFLSLLREIILRYSLHGFTILRLLCRRSSYLWTSFPRLMLLRLLCWCFSVYSWSNISSVLSLSTFSLYF